MSGPKHALASGRDGSRFYVHPTTGERYPSVTTVIQAAVAKPWLAPWAAKLTAEEAVARHDAISAMIDAGGSDAAIALLKGAHREKREGAANLGSRVHRAAEAWVKDEPMPAWEDDITPFMESFVDFLGQEDPEFLMMEATVCNPMEGYAGTLDAIVRLPGHDVTVVLDYKTGRAVYPEASLQLAAYAQAHEVWLPDDTVAVMPQTDGAVVLHIRADGYELVPVRANGHDFSTFCAMLDAYTWLSDTKDQALRCAWPTHGPARLSAVSHADR